MSGKSQIPNPKSQESGLIRIAAGLLLIAALAGLSGCSNARAYQDKGKPGSSFAQAGPILLPEIVATADAPAMLPEVVTTAERSGVVLLDTIFVTAERLPPSSDEEDALRATRDPGRPSDATSGVERPTSEVTTGGAGSTVIEPPEHKTHTQSFAPEKTRNQE